VARNDPTDTGGLFIGRRPGTAPMRLRRLPEGHEPSRRRRRFDEALAALVFLCQVVLCVSLWIPVPLAGLWLGSMVVPLIGSEMFGIFVAFVTIMVLLGVTLVILRRLDHVWKLVRRAAGHAQERGALERIFVTTAAIGAAAFLVWFLVFTGPGSLVVPERPG
jgi:hypothetical protein